MHQALSQLRAYLAQPPSKEVWDKLLFAAEDWAPEERDALGDYAHRHLLTWPSDLRIFRLYAPEHPLWSVVGRLHIQNKHYHPMGVLAPLQNLRSLHLHACEERRWLSGLTKLTQLEELGFHSCPALTRLDGVASLTNLTSIQITWCGRIKSFQGLVAAKKLKRLFFHGCPHLDDLTFLSDLPQLEELSLLDCRGLEGLAPLATLPCLRYLRLESVGESFLGRTLLPKMETRGEVMVFQEQLRRAVLDGERSK